MKKGLTVSLLMLVFALPVMAGDSIWLVRFAGDSERALFKERQVPVLILADDYALAVADQEQAAAFADFAREPLLPFDGSLTYYLIQTEAPETFTAQPGLTCVSLDHDTLLVAATSEAVTQLRSDRSRLVRLVPKLLRTTPLAAPRTAPARDHDPFIQAMVDCVNATDLHSRLTYLVNFTTRNSYTTGCQAAATFVHSFFGDLGLEASYHLHTGSMAPNVIGDLPGITAPDEIYIICGHLDSTAGNPSSAESNAPGADDNGTGSVAVLTAAEILSGYRFDRTLRFICFTGEEQGLYGSEAYAEMIASQGDNVLGVINFDMIGWSDPAPEDLEVICDTDSSGFGDAFVAAASLYTTLPMHKYIDNGNAYSDHFPFWMNGFPAFCGIEDSPPPYPYYHTVQDTVNRIDFGFFTDVVKAGIGALATFGAPLHEDLYYTSHAVEDSAGDADGRIDPGETVGIVVSLSNFMLEDATDVQATMSCMVGAQWLEIISQDAAFADIPAGQTAANTADPFLLRADPQTPIDTPVTLMLRITAAGGYVHIMGFEETVTTRREICPIYFEPLISNPGWSVSGGAWAFGHPNGQGGDSGSPDPTGGFTGISAYGYNLNGDYANNMPQYSLTSAPFDCSEYVDVQLRFQQWLGVERYRYDRAAVQVSNSGLNWVTVWENPDTALEGGSWVQVEYDISDVADHQPAVFIRWVMGPSDESVVYCGWNIDDIELCGAAYPTPLPTPSQGPYTWTPTPTRTPTPPLTPTRTPTGTLPVPTSTPGDHTPTALPSDTPVPGGVSLDITMNQHEFSGGDPLWVLCTVGNTGAARMADLYVALDVFGEYFFYPGWNSDLQCGRPSLEGDSVEYIDILILTLPQQLPAGGPFLFWAVLTEPGTFDLMADVDTVEFSFR